ncbi:MULTISPECIES: ABC transporter ATP-binding protein [Paenibacillus]|uniref:ABC transporter ATP-binding protein n=1 Tax=Paenibacillus TaxID=44249 RepID=UPI0004F89469|nr:oligopeptide/dipeptide ABC transporter ATP-binding protein [Paenibacillus odorifer]AIQ75845.1 peptide ABC transporter substrate-binding protein [Paenibacillus odorifer]
MPTNKSAAEEPLIDVKGLKTYYPIKKGIVSKTVGHVKAVDGVDFMINKGETLGLVGESGCGKSTVGRSVIRMEQLTEGSIHFQGQDITSYSQKQMRNIRTGMQMVFQDPFSSLNPRMTIGDILKEPIKVHRLVEPDKASLRVNQLLEMVGLSKSYINRYPHEFSGGQRQRIGVARALSVNPKLIICDEPVSALDVSIQSQILNLLKDLQQEFHFSYLFIGHGLGAVKYISDRIAVMYMGKIVETGKTEELMANPKHPYTKALLGAYPIPDPLMRKKERVIIQGDVPSQVNPPQGCRFHTRCPIASVECTQQEPLLKGGEHAVACLKVEEFGGLL